MLREPRTLLVTVLFLGNLLSAGPALSTTQPSGQDWYCSDPEAHQKYEKHLKQHLHHSGDAIAKKLDEIYCDSSLSAEEKKERALQVLDRYLMRMKAGVGD